MFSNSDFERLWFLYKTEGEPKGISINSFCVNQGVPYNQFNDWFRKTHKKIVPVQIDGIPSTNEDPVKDDTPKAIYSPSSGHFPAYFCTYYYVIKSYSNYE